MADIDGDGKDDMLVYDPNVGLSAPASCPATAGNPDPAKGGLRVLYGTTSTTPTISELQHPFTVSNGYWGQASTLCDIDNDGYADLAVQDASGVWTFWGSKTGIAAANPINLNNKTVVSAQSTGTVNPSAFNCVPNFFAAKALLHSYPGNVEIISGSANTATVIRTLSLPSPPDSAFGSYLPRGSADVNGDGKHDAVIGANGGKIWLIYGR